MQYKKKPLSIDEQISKLENRGLIFSNKKQAAQYLQNISYYRLRAFTYPYQDNREDANHEFIRDDIDFMDIIDLYVFDKRLRSLVFNEIEKIEIAVRTKLSLLYSLSTKNALWYENEKIYNHKAHIQKILEDIKSDIDRSNEDFIKHYKQKYDTPSMPPSWMTLEVVSFGTLSRLYKNLDSSYSEKRKIAEMYSRFLILEKINQCFSQYRDNFRHSFIDRQLICVRKIDFECICRCMGYILRKAYIFTSLTGSGQ